MALKVEEKTIGRYRYEVKQLGSKAGNDLLVRLGKVLGAGAALALMGGKASFRDAGLAIAGISERLSTEEFEHFCNVLGSSSRVVVNDRFEDMTPSFRDLHFAGEYMEQMDWLRFALEVNFKSFFDSAKSRAASLLPPSTNPAA